MGAVGALAGDTLVLRATRGGLVRARGVLEERCYECFIQLWVVVGEPVTLHLVLELAWELLSQWVPLHPVFQDAES